MRVLLDTHVLVSWFERPTRLSAPQKRAIRAGIQGGSLYVSDITLWEVGMLVEHERIELAVPLRDWLEAATAPPRVQRVGIAPAVVAELVQSASTFDWDPADRILVATARVLGASFVTSDQRIIEARLVRTIE